MHLINAAQNCLCQVVIARLFSFFKMQFLPSILDRSQVVFMIDKRHDFKVFQKGLVLYFLRQVCRGGNNNQKSKLLKSMYSFRRNSHIYNSSFLSKMFFDWVSIACEVNFMDNALKYIINKHFHPFFLTIWFRCIMNSICFVEFKIIHVYPFFRV